MTPQQLKNSILQLAIEGKLVEQRSEEGTGEELYQLIQIEKKNDLKKRKVKTQKLVPVIKDNEALFEIPSSWKWVKIDDVFDIVMGQSPSNNNISVDGDGIEFHQGKIYFGDRFLKKSSATTNTPLKIAPEGAVLLCVRAPVGKVNITNRCK